MFLKKNFDLYVSSNPIVKHPVYGSEYSIKLNLNDVRKNNFSVILGCYINERKACIEDAFAYIIPEYKSYEVRPQNFKKRKLLQYVSEKNFIALINEAEIVLKKRDEEDKVGKYYLMVSQDDIKRFNCIMVVSLLIDSGLAKLNHGDDKIYILYDFKQHLEKKSKIQSDLSRFRTLLGECNNLATLLELVEEGDIKDNKIEINKKKIKEMDLNIEIMSLLDVGIASCTDEDLIELDVVFASWLLEYVSNTSDRISFGDLYVD